MSTHPDGKSRIRKALVMYLKKGQETEYERRHRPIWPELEDVLKGHGVHNYSIFLNKGTMELFAYAEIESEERWRQIAGTEVCRRWWAHMSDLMETNPDQSPCSVELCEVFHI